MITIDSARAEYQRLIAEQRDGWIDLPCSGSFLVTNGAPRLASDKGNTDIGIGYLMREIGEVCGKRVVMSGGSHVDSRSKEWITPIRESPTRALV